MGKISVQHALTKARSVFYTEGAEALLIDIQQVTCGKRPSDCFSRVLFGGPLVLAHYPCISRLRTSGCPRGPREHSCDRRILKQCHLGRCIGVIAAILVRRALVMVARGTLPFTASLLACLPNVPNSFHINKSLPSRRVVLG